jgi:hypothetical protein
VSSALNLQCSAAPPRPGLIYSLCGGAGPSCQEPPRPGLIYSLCGGTSKTRANLFPVRRCGAELPRTSKTRANLFPVRRCGAKLHSRLVTIATSGSLQAPASLGSFDCVAFSLTSCSRHSSSPFLCRPIPPPSPLCPLHPLPSPHRLVYSLDLLFLSVSIIPPCDFFSALLFSSLLFSSLLFSSLLLFPALLFSSLPFFASLCFSPLLSRLTP